jgi:hypothetical protein
MIIAQSNQFTYVNNEWNEYPIRLYMPERDNSTENTFSCIIEIGKEEPKKIFGVDSLQTIILAVAHLKNRMKMLKNNGLHLYFYKDLNTEIDIDLVLRNDLSFYWNNGVLFKSENNKKDND